MWPDSKCQNATNNPNDREVHPDRQERECTGEDVDPRQAAESPLFAHPDPRDSHDGMNPTGNVTKINTDANAKEKQHDIECIGEWS